MSQTENQSHHILVNNAAAAPACFVQSHDALK